jgi:hypothetical protein
VGLAELAAYYMCVAHIAVARLLWRLNKRWRPSLLCRVFAVYLLRWPACRPAAMLRMSSSKAAVKQSKSKESNCSRVLDTIRPWHKPGVG